MYTLPRSAEGVSRPGSIRAVDVDSQEQRTNHEEAHLALAACGALTLALTGSAAAKQKSCGTFNTAGATTAVKIQRGNATCSTARHVLGDFFHHRGAMHGPANGPAYEQWWSVDRWACGYGAGGGGCSRGAALIQALWIGLS